MQSSVLYCEKANNYLNIREKKSDIYFRIVLIVSQRSLRTEFTNMFFSLLPQSKGVFFNWHVIEPYVDAAYLMCVPIVVAGKRAPNLKPQ
jgi:hypothetical protein